jgi:hypothetical protein
MDLALFIYFLNCQKKLKFIGPNAKIWENVCGLTLCSTSNRVTKKFLKPKQKT